MTYLVAGTDSPAYSASRPTFGTGNWTGVLTPDQVASDEAAVEGGPGISIGLQDGAMNTAFAMPSYSPNADPVSLVYSSNTADPQPIFLVRFPLSVGQEEPYNLVAQLTLNNGTPGPIIYYDTLNSNLSPGTDWVQIALQGDAGALSTGRYQWTIGVETDYTPQTTMGYDTLPPTYSGYVDIVNESSSPYGAGWMLGNVEQLVPVSGGVMVVNPDGTSLFFAGSGGSFTPPPGDFSTLVQNGDGSYTHILPDGTQINFNAAGQQTSIVDTDGNTTTFNYTGGVLTSITDMDGQTNTLNYLGGQLASITDPALRTATMGYTGNQLTSITDPGNPGNNLWQYAYQAANRLDVVTDPNNNSSAIGYTGGAVSVDPNTGAYNYLPSIATSVVRADSSTILVNSVQGNGLAVGGAGTQTTAEYLPMLATADQAQYTDGDGHVWTSGLDWLGFGLDVQDADPVGDAALTYRDANGLPWLSTDAFSERTRSFFDNLGNPTKVVAPDDSFWQYSYNQFSEITQATDPTNATTTLQYNSTGDLTKLIDPLNDITTFVHNAKGFLTNIIDPFTHTTTFGYNALNLLTTVTNALNQTTTLGYDNAANLTSETDPSGIVSTFAFNALNGLTGETLPVTGTTNAVYTYSYDNIGNITSALMPSGDTITYGYDKLYRQTGMDDTGDGQWANYAYDPAGYMTNISNSLSQTFDYGYDFAGRVTTVTNTTNGLNQTYTYTYNARNQVASVTNPLNQTTSYGYTILGQVSTVTDPRGGVTKYGYDLANDLLSLTDPNNNITTYAYNALHQVTSVTDPRNHTTTYDYHAGLLTQTTDRNNRTIDYGYDALNRLDSETWVGGNYTATYGYDTAGNLTVASDPFSTYTYGYNAANQLTSVDNAGTPSVPHVVLTYGYDTSNNRTSLTDSLGGIINYGYDSSRRLTSMGLSLNGTMAANLTFGYDVGSELTGITRTTPGGDTITSNFTYDGANRLTNITHSDATTGMTLASYTYGYNIGNQLTSYQDANSSLTYGYDPDGELTSASGTLAGSSFNATYSYDLNGNRNMPDYQTDPGNLLTNDGTYSYTYDNEGNTLTQTNIATGSVTYFTWDYRNRLTEEKQEDNQGHVLNDEMFTYDVNNNRIGTSVNGVQTWTVYDGSNPYMDFNGSGQLTERYLTNPNGLNQFYGQVNASGVTQWFLTDNLGSIRQVVDANGNPLYAVTYDPFGGNVSQTNPGNAPRFGYAGGEQDAILGIYHFNSRWYNPATGKWLSQDPLGLKPDSNPYRYVGNDPTNAIDPTGEADNRDPRYSEWYNKWLGPPGAYPSYPRLNRLTRGVDVYYPPPAGGAGSARMGPAGIASQVIESRRQQIGMTSGIRNVINQRFPGALNPSNGWQVVKRAKVWVRPLVLSGLTKGRQISITVNAKDAPIGSSVEVYFNGQRVPGDGKLGKGGTYDTKYKISINLPPLNPNMGRVNASDPPENNGYEIQAIIRPPGEGKEIIYGYARLPVYP